MPDFGDLEKDAKKEAGDHGSDVDKGVADAEKQADQRTGGKDDADVQKGGDEALGVDQSAQAQQ